eukprot:TCONS_00029164-protein
MAESIEDIWKELQGKKEPKEELKKELLDNLIDPLMPLRKKSKGKTLYGDRDPKKKRYPRKKTSRKGNTANMDVFESGSEFIIDDNDQDQGCSDSNDVTNDEDVLMDILDEAKELLGPVKKRTWGQRIENSESNWFAAREYLLEELVKREERPSSLCYKCFKAEATIKCVTCSPFLLLCPDCDFDFHQSIIFHDRQWFNGYFKPLKPDEHIKDGEIITIPKPMLLFKDCVSCGHLCDNCEIRTMNAQIA